MQELQFSSMECEKVVCHTLDCWMEIIEADMIKVINLIQFYNFLYNKWKILNKLLL